MEAIRANAGSLRREIQVYLHYSLEELFPNSLIQKFLAENVIYKDNPNASKGFFTRVSGKVHSTEFKAHCLNQKHIKCVDPGSNVLS